MIVEGHLDVALDLIILALVVFGVTLVWRIYRATAAIIGLVRRIDGSTAELDGARAQADALNDEIHRKSIEALEERIKALEGRRDQNP